jgi:hypothetical protein
MRFLEAASVVLFIAATIVLGATTPALSWDLTGEVTDPSGHEIGPSVMPSVSIDGAAALKAAGIGRNVFSLSLGCPPCMASFSFKGLPDSPLGCTITITIQGLSCFKGGLVRLARCGGPGQEHVKMNWTVYRDRSPRVTILGENGHGTEITALRTRRPIPVSGTVICKVRGQPEQVFGQRWIQPPTRPIEGVKVSVLDGNDGWRKIASATTDERGQYQMTVLPKCDEPDLKMILDPEGTGYQGGEIDDWGIIDWTLFTKSPPVVTAHGSLFGPQPRPRRAQPLKASGYGPPASQSIIDSNRPPAGSKDLPAPDDDGCI